MKRIKSELDTKPLAGLSLDLDNQWSYMKTHGESGWERFPSYFDIFLPPFLDLLDELNLKITFFIVGQDAALEKNANALKEVTKRGHEVGNHSFHHEPWLNLYSKEQIEMEILEAEKHIISVTGQRPSGFRGPGFSCSSDLLSILSKHKYMYDASTLPTYLGPFARLYYFRKSSLSNLEKSKRKDLFSNLKDGLMPVKPYLWQLLSGKILLEVPVTTVPFLKIPFHLSYLIYISRLSKQLMIFYLKMALFFCKITNTGLSFLLHPLDFLDKSQIPELSFFPGMDINKQEKIQIFKRVLRTILCHFRLVNMATVAATIIKENNIKKIQIRDYYKG